MYGKGGDEDVALREEHLAVALLFAELSIGRPGKARISRWKLCLTAAGVAGQPGSRVAG